MEIRGREIAADILAHVKDQTASLGSVPVVRAIVVAPTPVTASYLRIKSGASTAAGMELVVVELPETATTEEVIASVLLPGADAVIVQLPLPASINTKAVLESIPKEIDADCLSSASRERGAGILPPVAGAVHEICVRAGVSLEGARALVVGGGWLVGVPVAEYLRAHGAVVEVATHETKDLQRLLSTADIIISGAGVAGLISPEHIRKGVVLIDAGTSELDGSLRGDADPACAEIASVFTPVPGGVGPIAVACLFKNVAQLLAQKPQ